MPRTRIILLFVLLTATGLAGYLLVKGSNSQLGTTDDQSTHQVANQDADTANPGKLPLMSPTEESFDPTASGQDELADCISPEQFDADPLLSAEYARFDSLVTSGSMIESYRGLPSSQLGNLAIQGDSAAMAVLGAISVMRARNLPEDKAVDYLLREDTEVWSFSLAEHLEPEVVTHLEEARDWFYKSALHGRLLALHNAGEIIAIIGGSPAELGWIQQDEYDMMESYEQHALDPANVYGALAFEISPALRSGPMGSMISDLTPGGERQQLVLQELAWRFKQDREAAGLPPIEIPESTAPSMEELESMLCEP